MSEISARDLRRLAEALEKDLPGAREHVAAQLRRLAHLAREPHGCTITSSHNSHGRCPGIDFPEPDSDMQFKINQAAEAGIDPDAARAALEDERDHQCALASPHVTPRCLQCGEDVVLTSLGWCHNSGFYSCTFGGRLDPKRTAMPGTGWRVND